MDSICHSIGFVNLLHEGFPSVADDIEGVNRDRMVFSMAVSTSVLAFYEAFWRSVGGFDDLGCIIVALLLPFLIVLGCSFCIHFLILIIYNLYLRCVNQ